MFQSIKTLTAALVCLVANSLASSGSEQVITYLDATSHGSYLEDGGSFRRIDGVFVYWYGTESSAAHSRAMVEFDTRSPDNPTDTLDLLPGARVFWEVQDPVEVELDNASSITIDVAVYEGDGAVTQADYGRVSNLAGSVTLTRGTHSAVEIELTPALPRSMRAIGVNASSPQVMPWGERDMHSPGGGKLRAEDDPYEILRNSPLRIERNASSDTISAYFEPMGSLGPVDLSELAEALGVDHFNWLQYVTEQPDDWFLYRRDANGSNPVEVPTPWLDPDTMVENLSQMVMWHDELEASEAFYPQVEDRLPSYWREPDEIAEYTINEPELRLVEFFDAPRFPSGWFQPGEYVQFHTQLVGVNEGGIVQFDEVPGLSFTWKCNTTYDGSGAIYPKYYPEAPDAISGSIFDVRRVPEPASLNLLVLSMLCLQRVNGEGRRA